MANGRIYGTHLLQQNDGFSDSLLFPISSSTFQGSRSMVNFADVNLSDKSSFFRPFDPEENGDEEFDEYLRQPDKKRRLSVDQVQILERSFELENKLEPERKVQLARDLGLQPRQVAIWFQNRRARWKTKQLEKDYDALKSSYNCLKFNYENLLKEREKLKSEVLALTNQHLLKEKATNSPMPDQKSVLAPLDESVLVCKQEDISSTNSVVVDSCSPRLNDVGDQSSLLVEPAHSSHVFELDHSDLSQHEDDNNSSEGLVPSVYSFGKLEEPFYPNPPPTSSCNNGFLAEEHGSWFWSY